MPVMAHIVAYWSEWLTLLCGVDPLSKRWNRNVVGDTLVVDVSHAHELGLLGASGIGATSRDMAAKNGQFIVME